MANGDDFGAFLTGFVIGGLIGAGVALVLAPQSGEETRAQIRDRSIELRDRADDEVRELRRRADETLAEFRKQAGEIQEKALKSLEEARAKIAETVESGVEQVRKAAGSKDGETAAPGDAPAG